MNGYQDTRRSGLAGSGSGQSTVAAGHPVTQVLLDRAKSGSRPGARRDPYRVALVVEGGAMRGVVSGGMVAGLEALGLRDAFDVVYGSSAGACAGAYFVAGQARHGARLYYEVVNTRRFVNPLRSLQGRAMIDLDYLFGEVLSERLPLDFEAVQRSGIQLVVLASHLDGEHGSVGGQNSSANGTAGAHGHRRHVEAVRFSSFEDAADLLGALHASSRLPVVGGDPFTYRGQRFWDAAITQPIPVHAALADGCTHVLVLLTLPRNTRPRQMGLLDRLLVAPRVATVSPSLAEMYRTRSERYRETVHLILERSARTHESPYLLGVSADATAPLIGRSEIRAPLLVAAAQAGGDAVLTSLGRGDVRLDQTLQAVNARGEPIDVALRARDEPPGVRSRDGTGAYATASRNGTTYDREERA